jgi:hypothetical protein
MKLFRTAFLIAFALTMTSSVFAQHTLQVDDGASHYSKIIAPPATTTFTLPTNTGAAGQVLTSNGAGGTSFLPAGGFTPSFLYEYLPSPGFAFFIVPFGTVNFNTTGVNIGSAFTVGGGGAVTINETGFYQLDYSIFFDANPLNEVAVFVNGISVPGTDYQAIPNGQLAQGMSYLHLNIGDIVTLQNTSLFFMLLGNGGGVNYTISSLRMSRVQ